MRTSAGSRLRAARAPTLQLAAATHFVFNLLFTFIRCGHSPAFAGTAHLFGGSFTHQSAFRRRRLLFYLGACLLPILVRRAFLLACLLPQVVSARANLFL
ncbi:hypothetical protein Bxe_B1323 [Paraburkholderia xenovorans LB400]|uniref:Transmembrane protein n=1 Tax=Paraburkholderia xenovorans (strain LB400) TaxID=266265 RepID=Q13MQ0_PARXL|nr:hypothetical protein Bxe_B1323 [Paraburkholderia xenovorans LB400]